MEKTAVKDEFVHLASVCEAIVDCEHKTAPLERQGIPLIRTTNIKNGRIDFNHADRVSEATWQEWSKRLEPKLWDLILAREAPVGEVGLVSINDRLCLGQRTVLIRPNESLVVSRYLLYLLLTTPMQNQMRSLAEGSTVPHLNMSEIRALKIPKLPPLSYQEHVATILGTLDEKIEVNLKMNSILENLARALFKHWFVDFDYPNERGEPYKSSGGRLSNAVLGIIPDNWKIRTIDNVALINSKRISNDYPFTDIEYIDISSVKAGSLENTTKYKIEDAPSRAQMLVSDGDTIWSAVRPNRKSYLYINNPSKNLVVSTGFVVLTPRKVPPFYLYYWVTTDRFVDYLTYNADGSAYPAVRPQHFAQAPIAIPPDHILAQFEELVEPLRSRIAVNVQENHILIRLRNGLLHKLVLGVNKFDVKLPSVETVKQAHLSRQQKLNEWST